MAHETTDVVSEMFRQATETFNQTMRTGLKFHEQAAQFWTDTFSKNADQFRTQFEKVGNDVFPATKKNLDQFHNLFDQQAKKSLDMLRKTFEATQGWAGEDAREQSMNLWRTSFDAMRSSVDMVAKANTEMLHNWSELSRKACGTSGGKTNGKSSR